ncbi:MAG: nucleotidyltransferase domain-containing protein [Lachnospiraceae bacterium]|nr:nucleotidyltransferase domain-containing protein [Lachnospiraceae bacterium]
MVVIEEWLKLFEKQLRETFENRIVFIGLQGSYARGEATEESDIDIVVILDKLGGDDIRKYSEMLDKLDYREKVCGFLSGKEELSHWETSDLFQFYFDTKAIYGNIDEIKGKLNEETIQRAIKIGACNIYHACVHNMVHEKSEEILKGLYKAALFVIQAEYYQNEGVYVSRHKTLGTLVGEQEKEIIEQYARMKKNEEPDFQEASEQLFLWAKKKLIHV